MVICEMTFWIALGSSRYSSIKINALKLFKSTQRIAIPLLIHWASNPCFVSIIHKLIGACLYGTVELIFWFTGCTVNPDKSNQLTLNVGWDGMGYLVI